MAKLTKESRDALPASDFAVPGKRALPIHDEAHTRMAWDMVSKTKDLTPSERSEARRRIIERAKQHGIDTSEWEKGAKVAAAVSLSAMALNIPNDGHPNKMPFSGVLTRIGEPSDAAPEGSGGRRITISKEAAEKSLDSLLGMAVDYKPDFDGHAPQSKIGVISAATIEGNAILIEGFIYAADFPKEAAEIKARKDELGFSYEARDLYTDDPEANPCVITDCVFTGAAILLKAKAAYRTTSISANAAEDDETMTPELKELLDKLAANQATLSTAIEAVSASVEKLKTDGVSAANFTSLVEPHAKALESCAAAMEGAGMGGHATRGHVTVLRHMAGAMRADAAQGKMPHIYESTGQYYASADTRAAAAPDVAGEVAKKVNELVGPLTEQVKALGTQIADIKAAAVRDTPAPERKTVSPQITALLAKAGIEAPADGGKIELAKLDVALKDLPVERRLETKAALRQAGMLA